MPTNLVSRNLIFYLVFIAIGLIATVPAFNLGMIISDDVLVHLNWHRMFSAQLLEGQWYPRWLMDMNGGRGSPVFFYYPPLPYYISALVEWLLPAGANQYAALYLSFGLALGASGIACYRLLKSYVNENAAAVFAGFYILAPYHLFINFYHRFAYAETWAFVWTPLLFLALDDMLERNKFAKLPVVTALLICTHIPTAIMLTLPVMAYVAVNARTLAVIVRTVTGFLSGIALAAFYVVPMLSYYEYVSFNRMWLGKYDIRNNYLLNSSGFNNDYYLLLAIMCSMALAIVAFIYFRKHSRKTSYWLWLGIISILLLFDVSSVFWEFVPLYEKIQFPWRLNLLTLLSVTVLCAMIFNDRLGGFKVFYQFMLAFICLALLLSTFKNVSVLRERDLTPDEMIRLTNSLSAKPDVVEYLPRWISDQVVQNVREFKLDSPPMISGEQPDIAVEVVNWQPGQVVLRTLTDAETTVNVRQFYFPNWQAIIDEGDKLTLLPDVNGLIKLIVPAGDHTIRIEFVARHPETIGCMVSVLALMFSAIATCRKMMTSGNPTSR